MIGKKVVNAKGGRSKAARIGSLLDYIRSPERRLSEEKCTYYGARGFVTDSPGGHRAEMIALAEDAVRSADPVNHYILSWREGELPLPHQIEQAVSLFVDELGLQDHQIVYGLHTDTDNLHLHLAVNRVHPQTARAVKINQGFDVEALHRAVARIEHAQGWLPERRARYQVNMAGRVVRRPQDEIETRQPAPPKCDRETHTGEHSAERSAIEHAAPSIAGATSWQALHRALADKGMRYERAGSGAKVFVGGIAVKASRVARQASLRRLEQRLGAYEPAPPGLQVRASALPTPGPALPNWQQYRAERERHYVAKRAEWVELRATQDAHWQALRDRQRERRQRVLSGNFRGRGELLNGLRAALAEEQHTETRAQRQAHALARQHLRERHGRFPRFEPWLRRQGDEALAEQWRYRDRAARPSAQPDPAPDRTDASICARYTAAWEAREEARQQALSRVWTQHGRNVARLKAASKRRWAAVRVIAKGQVAAKLWALDARLADQRAWRRLHEQHREAVRAVHQRHPPLRWTDWVETIERGREQGVAGPRGSGMTTSASAPPEHQRQQPGRASVAGAAPQNQLPAPRRGRSR